MSIFALAPVELLVNHWYVVVIGLAFFAMQLGLCGRFWSRLRRQRRELGKLIEDLNEGGAGRDVEQFAGDIPWLKWVDVNFPRHAAPGNLSRDDVLNELDTQIGSNRDYLLLQRAGIMAPLLGVIITVIGFMALELPETESQTLGSLLFAVTPLVAGVGTGALLAFINQWLLHLVGGKVESVRYAARSWFDAAIWSGVGLDVQAATVKAITAMEAMARSVNQSAETQQRSQQELQASVTTIRASADQFQQTFAALGGQLQQIPAAMAELTAAASAAVETLQALVPVGQRALGGMDASVAAFRSAVEHHFVEAARLHRTANEEMQEAVGRINESTLQLKVSSGDLQESVNAHANAFRGLNRSLQKQVLPAHEAFLGTLSQFNGRAEGLLERLDSLHDGVIESLERITSLAPGAAEAVAAFSHGANAFSDAVCERFTPAAEQHQQAAGSLAESTRQLQQSARGLADGEDLVRKLAETQIHVSEELAEAQQVLRASIEQLAETGTALNGSLAADVVPAHRQLRQATGSFAESAGQFRGFLDRGLEPVLQRLQQLDQVLARVEVTARALGEFSAAGDDVQRLSGSLARAAQVSDALGALPQQVRGVLEELVRAEQERAASRSNGGVLSWLRGPHRPAAQRVNRR